MGAAGGDGPQAGAHGPKGGQGEVLAKKKKPSKKELKKSAAPPPPKKYVPPTRPKGYDPVDSLAPNLQREDPELYIVLKKLGKRDERTVDRGMEEFKTWVEGTQEGGGSVSEEVLGVWAYQFPRLVLHASRRIRSLTTAVQASLTSSAISSSFLVSPVNLTNPTYIGSWCLNAFDSDKTIRSRGQESWSSMLRVLNDEFYGLDEYVPTLIEFMETLLSAHPSDESDESSEEERVAMINKAVSAVDALSWLMRLDVAADDQEEAFVESFSALLASNDFWDILNGRQWSRRGKRSKFLPSRAPPVRTALWELFSKGLISNPRAKQNNVHSLSLRVLRFAWEEWEPPVQSAIWPGLLAFLKDHPEAWTYVEGEDKDETAKAFAPETESQPPATLSRFLEWLKVGCNGNPVGNYPVVIIILSTLPDGILPIRQATIDAFLAVVSSAWNTGSI
ncbi:hypothetical protein BT69DRAFT_1282520, partial [Atractiella rhizophila]